MSLDLFPLQNSKIDEFSAGIYNIVCATAIWAQPGFKSQSVRIADSQRAAIIVVNASRDSAGASSKHRRRRGCLGKSGPPTHHGSVREKTRGM